ncbi:MAG TPA: hypothetical protein PLR64_00465 [Candidatus Dojkabacteria bacterium]|nr:hypothetical protein [Candidatus Dojkabacteria bacterium]
MNKTEQKLVDTIERMLIAYPKSINKRRPSLQISKNTWVGEDYRESEDDRIVVYLFGNAIAYIYPRKGEVKITNAGFYTKTTKRRLNAIANVSTFVMKKIYQKNHHWYWEDGTPYDGMTSFPFLFLFYKDEPKKIHYALGKTQKQRKQEIEMNFRYA